ncbi:PKD domain-containing protein [Salinigranum salinum]|uniref:PKD domain-containing protein n=1 Tax=Salinigranum salinum TaxID=1364937 RepID=UPI0018644EFF|nr:PKD domain-containing protein [Salinigranum salinum]
MATVVFALLVLAAALPSPVVANESPTATFEYSPSTPNPDDTVTFDASASSDADGRIVDYEWYVGGGSYPDGDGETFTHAFETAGAYTIGLTVEDDNGSVDHYERTVPVKNAAPEARLSYTPSNPTPDETIRFTAADSADTDGRIVDYDWYVGSGSYSDGDGEHFETSFETAGTYQVTLEVEDNGEETDRITKTITVENAAPSATFEYSPETPSPDETVTFDASASDDADGEIVDYDWYVGSGSYADGDDVSFSHEFDTAGVYQVRLVVTDNGDETAEMTRQVNVTNAPPVPRFDVRSSSNGLDVTFDASASEDPDGRIVDYDWYVGTDSYADGDDATYTHEFEEAGRYDVRLVVTDNGDVTRERTETVGVSQRPTASIDYAGEAVPTGRTVTLSAAESVDPDGELTNYTWTLPDGTVAHGETVSTSVPAQGEYDVTLTVTDVTGNTHSVTETLVAKQPATVNLSWEPQTPRDDLDTTFYASASTPVETVEWDFDGDGEYDDGEGRMAVHAYNDTGRHTLGARVVAANGVATTQTAVVTVQQSAGFELTSAKTTISEGETAVVTLRASNFVRDTPMDVKMALDLPDTGASIASVDGASVTGAGETTFITVEPGQREQITVRIQFTEPGEHELGGTAVYYFDDSGSSDDRRTLAVTPISVTVHEDVDRSNPGSSTTTLPGFTAGDLVVVLLTCLLAAGLVARG